MNSKQVGGFVFLSYLTLRILLHTVGLEWSTWTWYGLEVGFLGVAAVLLQKAQSISSLRELLMPGPVSGRSAGSLFVIGLMAGFGIHRLAGIVGVEVPPLMSSSEWAVQLLLVAPILEELIFRWMLWGALALLLPGSVAVILVTTVLFSLSHAISYWSVPEFFQGFILYQSFYVLGLGGLLGWIRSRKNEIVSPILAHFGFNLGFGLSLFSAS